MFGNLLGTVLQVLPSNGVVEHLKFIGNTTNAAGYDVPTFAAPVAVAQCQVQAVPRVSYGFLNLDYQKDYVNWFIPRLVLGLDRDYSGDRMTYNGRLFQCVSATDWSQQDGWVQMLCVNITKGVTDATE